MGMTLQHEEIEADYKWQYYTNADGVDFEYAEHDYSTSSSFGSGHCFPGPVVKKNSYSCKQEAAYSYGRRVMEFFINHPKM